MLPYPDDFCTGNSNQIKERALLKELRQRLEEEVNFNIRDILREVYEVTRADMAASEKDQFYARYIKPMHIEIDQDGEAYLRLGKKTPTLKTGRSSPGPACFEVKIMLAGYDLAK